MKKLIILLTIVFYNSLISQTPMSYIIPDVGAPGMNVYYEIIGVHDDKYKYGNEDFYLNNEGDALRVMPLNLNDTNKVSFGPIQVSWSGRMISGQIFIKPGLEPNSWDWSLLDNEWKIPIQIIKDGSPLSDENHTFYIVQPFAFGNRSGFGERVLGQGQLGKRSPRGAMVVDEMILANDTYTVSKNNVDPSLPGNEGYLPFILLCVGDIQGLSNSKIVVNANGRHGGPGGGGGGGAFADNTTGTSGGDGFTGGGIGGTNNSLGSDSFENAGSGSGSNFNFLSENENYGGSSINGVKGAVSSGYESSGGGTGHPFGKSGGASWVPCSNCEGGYGAGSGNNDNGTGASGGFATDALNEGSFNNGGKSHGNIYGIPISGGSGAGGGNPKASLGNPQVKAGFGGGGGGAIRVFAKNITRLTIEANGADGQNGDPKGGAGSGGYVEIGTKENISDVVLSAARGSNRAGYGRFRSDARNNAPSIVPVNNLSQITTTIATEYKDFVDRDFNLSVKKNQNEVLDYYIRPENGEWQKLFTFDDLSQTNEVFNIDLNQWQDTIFYGMAIQSTEYDGSESDYAHIPEKILSQAAGNVFRVQEIKLICDQPRELDFSTCQPNSVYDTVWVKNIGTVNRTHVTFNPGDANKAYWEVDDGAFTVLEPTDIAYFDDEDSLKIRVRYNHQVGRTGVYSNTLTIPYGPNLIDIDGEYQIEYKVDINNLNVDWIRANGDLIENDSLILEICVNEPFSETLEIQNNSAEKFTIKDIRFNGQEDDFSLSFLQDEVLPGERFPFQIGVDENASEKNYFAKIYLEVDECEGIADSIIFIVNIKQSLLEQENNLGNIDFGDVNTVQTKTLIRKFKNVGNIPAYIPSPPEILPEPPFEYIGANRTFPLTLDVGEEVEFEIRFSPTDPISYSGTFTLLMEKTDLLCSQTATFNLNGNGIESNLLFPYVLDWGTLQDCKSVNDSTITIYNNSSNLDVTINGSHTITGANPDNWEITNNIPQNGNIIPRNSGELTFDIRYKPEIGPDGPKSAILLIPTDDVSLPQNPNNPNQYLIEIELKAVKEGLNITVVPNSTLNFGEVPINEESISLPIDITNNSNVTTRLLQVIEPSNFKMNGVNQTFAPGQTKTVDITVTLDKVGLYEENFEIIFDISSGTLNNCPATYTMQAEAVGIKGESEIIPSELDFGYINKCQLDESLTFTIENIDKVPITMSNISIDGLDEQYFSLDNFTANDEIEQDEKITYTVNFNPPDPVSYGTFTANVNISMIENTLDTTYVLPINVEISKGFTATPIILDFENQIMSFPKVKDLVFRNLHNWEIILGDVNQVPNEYPTFSINDLDLDNRDIATTYYTPITFTPPGVGSYEDELEIPYTIDGYCQETVTVILRGDGTPASALRIFIPDQVVDPTLDYIEIPVYSQITEGTTQIQTYAIESMTITMDKSTFHPISLTKGSISGIEYSNNDELILTISVNGVVSNEKETELTRIYANPLLGENKFSKINLSNASIDINEIFSSISYDETDVELLICEEGGDRLLINNSNIDLSFALTKSLLKTEIEIIEAGYNKIEIISMEGRVIASEDWIRDIGGNNHYSFNFDIDEFATGLYLIRLTTPNDIITKKIIINR